MLCLLSAGPAAAQDVAVPPPAEPAIAALIAAAGTKVELMVINEVTTKTAKAGDRFLLKLAQPLVAGDRVLIPRGVPAWGEVTETKTNGIAGRSGKLATKLLYIDFQGTKLPLNGSPSHTGQGGNLQIVMATLALTPWGLIAKGNNAKLKAGDIVSGYLDQAFPPAALPAPAPSLAAPPNSADLRLP